MKCGNRIRADDECVLICSGLACYRGAGSVTMGYYRLPIGYSGLPEITARLLVSCIFQSQKEQLNRSRCWCDNQPNETSFCVRTDSSSASQISKAVRPSAAVTVSGRLPLTTHSTA